jgi:hypothetical protein
MIDNYKAYENFMALEKADLSAFPELLNKCAGNCDVLDVRTGGWGRSEFPLYQWFGKNFVRLGFQDAIPETLSRYHHLKKELKWEPSYFPDYIALKDSELVAVEIELCTCRFQHPADYCDYVVCYLDCRPIPEKMRCLALQYDMVITREDLVTDMCFESQEFAKYFHDLERKLLEERKLEYLRIEERDAALTVLKKKISMLPREPTQ